jgi:hypothetical protein
MKLTCAQWCRVQQWLGNLKCPNCFSATVKPSRVHNDMNAPGQDCQCELKFDPDLLKRME